VSAERQAQLADDKEGGFTVVEDRRKERKKRKREERERKLQRQKERQERKLRKDRAEIGRGGRHWRQRSTPLSRRPTQFLSGRKRRPALKTTSGRRNESTARERQRQM